MNRFWRFLDVYLAGDGSLQPSTFPIVPFQLAEKIEPLGEMGELGFLVRAVPLLVLRDPSMRYPTFHEVSIKPASAARARPTA
jgi:hypothetical protein